MNQFLTALRATLPYSQAIQQIDLTRAANLHYLRLRLTASVTIAGGTTSGTVLADGPARLLQSIRCVHDGFQFVEPVSGRDLYLLTRRCFPQVVALTNLADGAAQAGTAISVEFVVPFSWRGLANPYEMFWPAMAVRQELSAYVQFETATANANSSAGTGALLTGSDRTVTFASGPTLELVEEYSFAAVAPVYAPVLTVGNSDQFAAANGALDYRLRTSRRLAWQMFANRYGTNKLAQDGLNTVILQAGNVRWMDAISAVALKTRERNEFPAVGTDSLESGVLFLNYLDNGKLGTALDPKSMGTDPRFTFDVDAPTSGTGQLSVLAGELRVIPGVTAAQVP